LLARHTLPIWAVLPCAFSKTALICLEMPIED
jgi:hypothetical protein